MTNTIPIDTNKHEIMIVDDLTENLGLLNELFKSEGYDVRSANSGELALLSINKKQPDLILLDIKMPSLDGFEVCKKLKTDEKTKNIPIIFISALSETDEKIKGFDVGAVDFITKPFDRKEVLMRVKTHIELRKLQVETEKRNAELQMEIENRIAVEEKLRSSEEQLKITLQSIGDGIIVTDIHSSIVLLNKISEEFTGWSNKNAFGKTFEEVFQITNEITGKKAKNPVEEALSKDAVCELENHTLLTSKDGIIRHIADSAAPIKDRDGKTNGVVMVFRDVTDKKVAEKQLKLSAEIIEKMQTGMYLYRLEDQSDDRTLRLINANEASTKQIGLQKEKILGLFIDEIFPNLRQNDIPRKFADVVRTGIPYESEEFHYSDDHVATACFAFKVFRIQKDSVCVLFEDITIRKKQSEEIKHLSFHDTLTGLYNRTYLVNEMKTIDRDEMLPISVIMGDVNGLKLINDVYGHDTGDNFLKKAATGLLQSCPRDSIISRWGGDEFVIILPNTAKAQAEKTVNNIKKGFRESDFGPVSISVALGLATKTENTTRIKDTIREAEDIMYTHKLVEGKSVRSTIILSLQKTLYERSCETEEHAVRMIELGKMIGQRIALSQYELDEMELLCVLHDIGKIGIADSILNKSGKLSNDEWHEMKKHSEIGYRIAQSTPELAHISELILCHHEHWNGAGYPQSIKEENIPLLSRILTIIDAYDVMTNGRPYKAAISKRDALVELNRCSGTQFDPELIREFILAIS